MVKPYARFLLAFAALLLAVGVMIALLFLLLGALTLRGAAGAG